MNMTWVQIDKEDTRQLKGLAILVVVLHNFLHWVEPLVSENEFAFHGGDFQRYARLMAEHPSEVLHLTLAFYGHYPVLIFLLLSAYGLTRRYGRRAVDLRAFWSRRLFRIYSVFVLAVLVHAASIALSPRAELEWSYATSYALKLSGLANLIPGKALSLVGPWWFLSVILQFYLVFPVLARWGRQRGATTLLVVAMAGMLARVLLNPMLVPHQLNLLHTVSGYLPELCAGILLANARPFRVPRGASLGLVALIALSGWSRTAWLVTPLCLTVLAAFYGKRLAATLGSLAPLRRAFGYLGDHSLALFALHGFFRPPFVRWANADPRWYSTLLISLIYLAAVLVAAHLTHWGAIHVQRSGSRLLSPHLSRAGKP